MKLVSIMIVLVSVCSLFASDKKNYETGEIIVGFHEKVTEDEIERFVLRYEKYEFKLKGIISHKFFLRTYYFNDQLIDADELLRVIQEDDVVDSATFNRIFQLDRELRGEI